MPTNATRAVVRSAPTRAAVARVGWGSRRRRRRRRRRITGVRDEEKERYDRKSLAPRPAPLVRPATQHPQRSGLANACPDQIATGFIFWFFFICTCLRNFPPLFLTFAPTKSFLSLYISSFNNLGFFLFCFVFVFVFVPFFYPSLLLHSLASLYLHGPPSSPVSLHHPRQLPARCA